MEGTGPFPNYTNWLKLRQVLNRSASQADVQTICRLVTTNFNTNDFRITTTNFPPVFAGTLISNTNQGRYDPVYPPTGVNLHWWIAGTDPTAVNSPIILVASNHTAYAFWFESSGPWPYYTNWLKMRPVLNRGGVLGGSDPLPTCDDEYREWQLGVKEQQHGDQYHSTSFLFPLR